MRRQKSPRLQVRGACELKPSRNIAISRIARFGGAISSVEPWIVSHARKPKETAKAIATPKEAFQADPEGVQPRIEKFFANAKEGIRRR